MPDGRIQTAQEWPVADLIEWARTTRYFGPEDFEKLAQLADEVERAREYAVGLGGWFNDEEPHV